MNVEISTSDEDNFDIYMDERQKAVLENDLRDSHVDWVEVHPIGGQRILINKAHIVSVEFPS